MIKSTNSFVKKFAFLMPFYYLTVSASNANDITGTWKNIDDNTNKAKSIIEIVRDNGIYTGKIIELLNPSSPNPLCTKCSGDDANQPIKGLTIIKGVSKKQGSWSGGTILDPKKGKAYKVTFTLIDNGQKLKVRGFIGIPALGRTQIWLRQSN